MLTVLLKLMTPEELELNTCRLVPSLSRGSSIAKAKDNSIDSIAKQIPVVIPEPALKKVKDERHFTSTSQAVGLGAME